MVEIKMKLLLLLLVFVTFVCSYVFCFETDLIFQKVKRNQVIIITGQFNKSFIVNIMLRNSDVLYVEYKTNKNDEWKFVPQGPMDFCLLNNLPYCIPYWQSNKIRFFNVKKSAYYKITIIRKVK